MGVSRLRALSKKSTYLLRYSSGLLLLDDNSEVENRTLRFVRRLQVVDIHSVVLGYILSGSVLEAQDVDTTHGTSKNLWPFGEVSSLTIFHRWNPNSGCLHSPIIRYVIYMEYSTSGCSFPLNER